MQWSLENLKLTVHRWVAGTRRLLDGIRYEVSRIKPLIFESTISAMIGNMFKAIEATFRAVIYLLILSMGVSMAGLGAFTIVCLAIRIGQFLWVLIFADKWI
jgi:hypothetical protein